ncbi:PMT family glycosyltransferase, 4-amino-4-deoxy-L-arabinose transferase [Cylindrospermum stagnale PCC 7417]|uniref:PMT family glycosyltransferase, 4-amino-4-deoxy-L-arabinose transferase n=1 Tax=Cylindrospermum stagnale PCC 7417 TaxID=56107 RepID=K9X262_9NOST|nr:glycosyltransferase family 39 protein [Cylindrospermum stagnale]AFZ26548.1 PMT family glycosyltransferase, 4-amino-4-deoxy-L-arabinose transferase [Cylindrospermum stagnale PCC 7417]
MQIAQKWLAEKTNQSVVLLLVGGLLFRALIAFCFYPTFDEAYYYIYSLHLDWSYFDHPVLVALTTGFGPWLTGEASQFTIRLGALICHTGSLILLYLTSLRLFSPKAALLTLAIATICPIFQIGFGILSLPDSPLMLFWSASLYCAVAEFLPRQEDQKHSLLYQPSYRLAILGILVGLACLSKYHGFVLGFGLIGFCLTSPRHRPAILSPWGWLGIGLFFLTISPMLFWNIHHDWVSFRFQSERAVPKNGYNLLNVTLTGLLGVAYMFPTIGFPLWWVSMDSLITQVKQIFSQRSPTKDGDLDATKLLILWVSLPLILGFTLMGGYRQILPGWTMPGFWGITLLLGQQAIKWSQQSRRWVRRWLFGSGIMVSSILLILLLQVTTGIIQKPGQYAFMGGFLAPKDDPSTELIDIQQLRRGFAESPVISAALKKSSFIFTNRYYIGGPIAMSLQPITQIPITCFDIGNNQGVKDQRGFAFWSKADQWLGEDGLYITTAPFNLRKDLMANYRTYFNSLSEIETIPIRRGGVVINNIYVYQAKTLLKPYPRSYGI